VNHAVPSISSADNDSFRKYKPNIDIPNSFYLETTNYAEVFEVISKLKPKKSTGQDGINSIVIQKSAEKMSKPLSILINYIFKTKTFPEVLKMAKVVPVYKKNNKNDLNNNLSTDSAAFVFYQSSRTVAAQSII